MHTDFKNSFGERWRPCTCFAEKIAILTWFSSFYRSPFCCGLYSHCPRCFHSSVVVFQLRFVTFRSVFARFLQKFSSFRRSCSFSRRSRSFCRQSRSFFHRSRTSFRRSLCVRLFCAPQRENRPTLPNFSFFRMAKQ